MLPGPRNSLSLNLFLAATAIMCIVQMIQIPFTEQLIPISWYTAGEGLAGRLPQLSLRQADIGLSQLKDSLATQNLNEFGLSLTPDVVYGTCGGKGTGLRSYEAAVEKYGTFRCFDNLQEGQFQGRCGKRHPPTEAGMAYQMSHLDKP